MLRAGTEGNPDVPTDGQAAQADPAGRGTGSGEELDTPMTETVVSAGQQS